MDQITTIGIELAKNDFQIHGVGEDARSFCAGNCDAARFWRISRPFLRAWIGGLRWRAFFGLTPCHRRDGPLNWARELIALGHEVRIMVSRDRDPGGAAKAHRTMQKRYARLWSRSRGDHSLRWSE